MYAQGDAGGSAGFLLGNGGAGCAEANSPLGSLVGAGGAGGLDATGTGAGNGGTGSLLFGQDGANGTP